MRNRYVFPEVATKAEAKIRAQVSAHGYDAIEDDREFARRLTEDLRAVCHDVHLRVGYSRDVLPERLDTGRPSAAELAEELRLEREQNGGFSRVERLEGNVGYIRYDQVASPVASREPLRAAMDLIARTEALIIDLRTNHGGEPETVQMFCSYLFDRPTHLNDLWYRATGKTTAYWTSARVAGSRYLNRPVYIVVSRETGSAAEELAYDLQALRRATIVGEPTWGGANPGDDVRLTNHFHAFIPNGRAINPITRTNWEGVGVIPDVKAPNDALKEAHGLAIQNLLTETTDVAKRARLTRALKLVTKSDNGEE